MAEEEKVGDSIPGESKEDPQEILGNAILGKTKEGTPSEEPKGEIEKPAEGDQKKEEEGKTEREEEKAEAPSDIEVQTQKLFEKHKGDPKEMAKALANLTSLQGKQGTELGDLRTRNLEFDALIRKMHDDPDAVKRDIDALHKKEQEEVSLLDQAIEKPEKLPQYIKSEVRKELTAIKDQKELDEELTKIYPNYKQSKSARESLADQIDAGRFSPNEVLQLAVDGYYARQQIEDAKNLARQEDKDTLAEKEGQQVDKQGVLTPEGRELDLTDEDVKQDVLGDAILKARR